MAGTAVILIGHGAPATDTPPYLVFKLKQLSARRRALAMPPSDEEVEVEQKIRTWPRREDNDPYRKGIEAVAAALAPLLAPDVVVRVAYCEYCEPTLEGVVREVVENGSDRVVVVPSMVTPGGVHSESDVPQMIEAARSAFPSVEFVYAWPFELADVAALFARGVAKHGVTERT
jgi:sirohydrochlorin cobaltochelatase